VSERTKDLGFARVDVDREQRQGAAEVIYGEGKLPEDIREIARALLDAGQNVLVTRLPKGGLEALADLPGEVEHNERARCARIVQKPRESIGRVALLCAGTSDLPVAEEAGFTLEFLGAEVERVYDVGVAGLHRLLDADGGWKTADCVVVVAGMDGALPSVVGGLTGCPVIAVPTSVGYGASFGGLSALLAMLNSCSAGVAVVNIDNGFGAARAAHRILRGKRS
jgi:NCAIR mutase (PurE)-related protein